MTPPAFIEAGCGRCHLAESVTGAAVLSRGRALMARAGCYACHIVRAQEAFRSEAPPLATLPLKTGGEWLKRWLKDPKSIDPNATMPNFHLTDQAIDELSHYLFAAQVPKELAARIEAAAAEPAGSSANGKKLFVGVALHHLPHSRGKGKRLGARALQDRLNFVAGLAARVPARAAGLQPAHPDAALSLQRGRVARRRRLSRGRVPRLRRPKEHPRAASREPDPRRERRASSSGSTAASPVTTRPEPARRSSGRSWTGSATRGRSRSTSAAVRTSLARSRRGSPQSSSRRARSPTA